MTPTPSHSGLAAAEPFSVSGLGRNVMSWEAQPAPSLHSNIFITQYPTESRCHSQARAQRTHRKLHRTDETVRPAFPRCSGSLWGYTPALPLLWTPSFSKPRGLAVVESRGAQGRPTYTCNYPSQRAGLAAGRAGGGEAPAPLSSGAFAANQTRLRTGFSHRRYGLCLANWSMPFHGCCGLAGSGRLMQCPEQARGQWDVAGMTTAFAFALNTDR
jgi:hypothetical protein